LFPLDLELAIGSDYSLRRQSDPVGASACGVREPNTDALAVAGAGSNSEASDIKLWLRLGRGSEARRVRVGDRPIQIGTAQHNDLVLWDKAVSAEHCRIEPGDGALFIRDLDSRNGTHVQGVRVSLCDLRPGVGVRIGRTELVVVEQRERHSSTSDTSPMVAASNAMRQVLEDARRWSTLPWPVLVQGESGVGKEGVANALHTGGSRARKPFVALNAGGLPRELVESELFGHERGAFTGATHGHRGVFEQADGGTLFLDEIGELPLDLQARLLRVLETGEIRRVGAETCLRVDVRLVCATHRDLSAMVQRGEFRGDLYYRIARLVIEVPPLRERPEDIAALVDHFLLQMAPDVGKRELSPDAYGRVLAYPWPGNARELRNILSTASATTSSEQIDAVDVELALRRMGAAEAHGAVTLATLQSAVAAQKGNKAAAARVLGIARSTLRDRLRQGADTAGPAKASPTSTAGQTHPADRRPRS
jgi:transcriptional regulator with AAA-type ATPase domain